MVHCDFSVALRCNSQSSLTDRQFGTIHYVGFACLCDLKKAGDWAIVTGATDGIGKAFAHELARDGMNVFLISRSTEKLTKVADEIQSLFKVETKIFAANFTTTDFYKNLRREIEELPSISILINNVGTSYSHPDALATCDDLTLEKLQSMIVCNVTSATCMTRIALPKMLSSPPPDGVHRYIVNIASQSGCFPTPYLSVYAGTKAFVVHFTASLAGELAGTCVKVQTISPGFVATAMTGLKRPTFFAPGASTFAASALSMLGVASETCGYFAHELFLTFVLALPAWLRSVTFARHMLKIRDRYYKRQKSKNL
ncbi:Inactive hydroxysteroid dehydrogenase-like protein 1 [Sparganum proliferum]